jgi:7,8-dihydropterin-6-yl-methyl-4-(beta-D-ribofuranosyl)aminobenzene 5'-phosphate synthase
MILQQVEEVKITILMDNYTDILLSNTANVQRPPIINKNSDGLLTPIAEHGFSALIELKYLKGNDIEKDLFLFDTGVTPKGVLNNLDTLSISIEHLNGIILSHGHIDHYNGLLKILEHISKPVSVYAHPDAFFKRWTILPSGLKAFTLLDEENLRKHGAIINKNTGITLLPISDNNPRMLITGQIPRLTNFERGFPFQYKEHEETGELVHDPFIYDDQALVVVVKDKGLVVITACGHAGVINTIDYAKKITGIREVYAILGGFHLSGEIYEPVIGVTIQELMKVKAKFIVPCHCTGWKAVNQIIKFMPESFIQSSVGSTFKF